MNDVWFKTYAGSCVGTTEKNGLFVQYDSQGRVVHFGWYVDGGSVQYIDVEPDARQGKRIYGQYHEVYRDGTYEHFDSWSDTDLPKKMDFDRWLESRLLEIICLYLGSRGPRTNEISQLLTQAIRQRDAIKYS